jgi:Xaa-Pro dipeptidase
MEMVDIDNVVSWNRSEGSAQEKVAGILSDLGLAADRIGFEDQYLSFAQVQALQDAFPKAELVPASEITRKLRVVKSADELEYLRQAGAVSGKAMGAAVQALRAGGRECDGAAAAEAVWRDHGMGAAYEPLIGSGQRSAMLRRFPGKKKPQSGEMVRMDFAAKYAFASGYAYHTDITRCFVMGEPSDRQRRQLDLTLAVQQKALDGMRPGRKISDISSEALALVNGTEFEGLCSMGGHGLGLEVHEWPGFNETVEVELQAGMAFAVEPSIVIPGGDGTCVEDTVLVTETGIERVTTLEQKLW